MFPFKTDVLELKTKKKEIEIQKIVEGFVSKEIFFELKSSNKLYGKIKQGYAVYTLGSSPQRNSFIPMTVLKWKSEGEYTTVVSFFRLDNRITVGISTLLICSCIIAIQSGNIMPVVSLVILLGVLLIFIHLFYQKSKTVLAEKNTEILNQIGSVLD